MPHRQLTDAVEVDGRRVAYAAYGDADGPAVLLCHGSPGSRVDGELLAEAAERAGLRLLVPDRPGVDASAFRPDRTVGDWADTAAALADAWGVEEIGVLGYSGGGPYALATAIAHPERVSTVGLLAAAAPPEAPQGEADGSLRALGILLHRAPTVARLLFRGTAWMTARRSPAFAAGFFTDRPIGDAGVDPAVAEVLRATLLESVRAGARGTVADLRLIDEPWDVDLADVDVPVVARYGGADANVPAARGAWLVERLPDASIEVLPGADHLGVLTEAGPALLRRVAP